MVISGKMPRLFPDSKFQVSRDIANQLPHLSMCVSSGFLKNLQTDFREKNFSSIIGVIGRREWIKTSGKFGPLMRKNSENSEKLPTSRSPRATHARWRAQWPAVSVRELA